MKICNLHSPDSLDRAVAVIQEGGILVYPTDTIYGFGVNATDEQAVFKLSQVKKRGGPWSIIVDNWNMLKSYAKVSENNENFIKSHLPGKITVILPAKKSNLSIDILSKNKTVGIRIPTHPFPRRLVSILGYPITTTSVNKTGQPPLNDPEKIEKEFNKQVDLMIDDGPITSPKGSRIYDLTGKDLQIIRE